MTFKPTKKLQEQWVEKHLNGGELPQDKKAYESRLSRNCQSACYPALEWLESAKPDITTLAEAWRRCPRPDWLVWSLMYMNPNRQDVQRVLKTLQTAFQAIMRSGDSKILSFYSYGSEAQDALRYVEELFEERATSPKAMLRSLMVIASEVFDHVRSPEAEKVCKKYARLFRRHLPNPWL